MSYTCKKCNKKFKLEIYLTKHIAKNDCIQNINKQDVAIDNLGKEDLNLLVKELLNKNDIILRKLEGIESMLMHNKIKKINENKDENIKVIKKCRLDLEDSVILEYLSKSSMEDDCELLSKYYLDNVSNEFLPIKKIKKGESTFWNGNEWITQKNNTDLRDILCANLRKTYTRVNKLDSNNSENFLNYQEHISKLSDKKYKGLLINYFIDNHC